MPPQILFKQYIIIHNKRQFYLDLYVLDVIKRAENEIKVIKMILFSTVQIVCFYIIIILSNFI
ncbi:Uncharacterised protein [Staphylococcus nepalensis]|uniref:Uncharacterized protein n=1 Tax=Staphylococcus nepalensis TaxID=214473 RepID=A0A380GJY2_9STAP|nr:Uncharacterised protein [Staphylococcus nepalensis]SUM67928.1 Uncharacterised protein [Staphylococcus nepalensis]VDG66724.1 Uncharacterised protein [Lacrimispora indolis]